MASEAIKPSEIEGEYLSRQDVISSIKKNLGIYDSHPRQVKDLRAKGIADLLVTVRESYNMPLSKKILFEWHNLLMMGTTRITAGKWRADNTPMQVVSASIGKESIHFEAPPSSCVPEEMRNYIKWYNYTMQGAYSDIKWNNK